ncbi:Dps family protein [Amygdalobacter nucleatus]|uniref:Ferritin-like protein n=1 Tax=Amygdalobacter nucleatus TaxID=3029274 RepID=A0A133Y6H1_9FIRM|nr:DNA starvation/stationary phase protection protein [Amygdalobacter nucleatus]KXB38786.1 ferritin-like protein [Amygdalobacter nucleatus]MDF0485914.1 DNA starvation/stationary phase protection protein [Amygdalobacter nucleatus]
MDKKLQEMLNVYCANFGLGYIKVCNLHWNVKGKGFITAHKYLESEYENWAEYLDEVAEHLRINGVCPPATLKAYLELATLKEKVSEEVECMDAYQIWYKDMETQCALAKEIRAYADEIGAVDTANMLDDQIADFNKALWMLKMQISD